MAIETINKENTFPPDADFLGGSTKDDTGLNDGTPANRNTFNDFFEFFTKLLSRQSVTPNGVLESEYSGHQYHDALDGLIDDRIDVKIANGTWTDATLASDTTNTGSGQPNAGYTIDKMGRVTLRGRVTYTGPSTGTNLNLFTLPTGLRPPVAGKQNYICEFAIVGYTITSFTNSNQWSIQILPTGEVNLLAFTRINPGDHIDLSLDGISFLTY